MASEAKGEAQDAIMGIAAVPGETTADMLTKATQGDQRGVSSSAAWLLARRGEAGVRWLAEIASAKHGSTQWAAIRALGVSDVSEAEIELAKLLGNADPKTRLRAFEALAGRQGLSPTTMERMAMLQVDPDPEVSARAQEHDRRYERMAEHVRLAAEREGNPVQAQLLRDVLQRIEEEAKGDAVPRQALPSEANDGGGPAKEPPSATAKTDDNTGDAVLDSDLHPGERVQKRPHEGAGRRDGAEQAGVTEAPGTRNEPGNAWLVTGAAALLACAVCAAGAWLLLRRRAGRRTA